MIAEVIKAHEVGSKKATKTKGKKGKKGKESEKDESILKELRNALRPVWVERRGEEGSRPSTPMRSAHDQLMESIRNSSIRNLRRVSGRICAPGTFKWSFFISWSEFAFHSFSFSILSVVLSPTYCMHNIFLNAVYI